MIPSKDEYFLSMASLVSSRASCVRRAVGCVIVDKHSHVLSTGYNGPATNTPSCTPDSCPGSNAPSGTNLEGCRAVHAEQNALLQCNDVQQISKIYINVAPCITCMKMIMNTSCEEIIYAKPYSHMQEVWNLAMGAGITMKEWDENNATTLIRT
jgi:dCMP deaminase